MVIMWVFTVYGLQFFDGLFEPPKICDKLFHILQTHAHLIQFGRLALELPDKCRHKCFLLKYVQYDFIVVPFNIARVSMLHFIFGQVFFAALKSMLQFIFDQLLCFALRFGHVLTLFFFFGRRLTEVAVVCFILHN